MSDKIRIFVVKRNERQNEEMSDKMEKRVPIKKAIRLLFLIVKDYKTYNNKTYNNKL